MLYVSHFFVIFFFKQKTAYEMRISDWSSDVCSSDILARIEELLAEAGSDKTKLLSATIWLTDIATFDEMNGIWDAWVAPGAAPARACVEAKPASPPYNVAIAVVAARCRPCIAGFRRQGGERRAERDDALPDN